MIGQCIVYVSTSFRWLYATLRSLHVSCNVQKLEVLCFLVRVKRGHLHAIRSTQLQRMQGASTTDRGFVDWAARV
jgi:hypothetical protein